MSKPVLGYWKIRGLAEPARSVLHYAGIDYEEKYYEFCTDDMSKIEEVLKSWLPEKEANPHGLDFPNLPYLVDGDLKLTQSIAILRYVAAKAGLTIEDCPKAKAKLEMLEQQAVDLRMNIIQFSYGGGLTALKYPNYDEGIPKQLKPWSDYLGEKTWLMGDKLTYADFLLYEGLDMHKLYKDSCLDDFPNLKAYWQRFRDEPKIKEYLQSDSYIEWPLFSPFAKVFGYERKQ